MDIDFADLLMEVVSRRASDLHLSVGAHPTVRSRGRLTQLKDYPKLSESDTREIVYAILSGDQRQRLETDWQIDFAYSIPGHARFRVNAYFQRGAIGAAFRLIPFNLSTIDELGLPAAVHDFTHEPLTQFGASGFVHCASAVQAGVPLVPPPEGLQTPLSHVNPSPHEAVSQLARH